MVLISAHTYIFLQATSTKLIASPKNYPYELQALVHALAETLKLSSKSCDIVRSIRAFALNLSW